MSETQITTDQTQFVETKQDSNFKRLLRSFKKNKLALYSLYVIILLLLIVIFGPWITPYDPQEANYDSILEAPSWQHLAGTDEFGKDVLSRLIVGARLSLGVGVSAVLLGAVAGTILGLISGFFGKWVDRVIMRICDILFAFPDLVLAIAMVAILGPGMKNVIIAIAFFSTPSFARIVRGETLEIKERLFIEAERSIGAKKSRIILRHVFPQTISTIIVYITMNIGGAIISAASLSFLGLGASPSSPEWGAMLSASRDYIGHAFHLIFFPGLAVFITVLVLNLFGDGLRDVLDPKTRD
ncbi:ABC transporter permease [Oceanobacillus neutriphilus]|uniref:Glutathione transport system permease protein GsiD n=1 Tax=Oceanobacillus neutriphilus TaxID=531815 RepID=A0ABQ2NT54_9BACI|nr:ABC transporter permease subunit [Oceanobacillus neutriphilus]GGP10288.1 glutathione ABC transporter permease GsiD [Oceanobacillus neutriphilus]